MKQKIEIYLLAYRYFFQQGFTNWRYAFDMAKYIVEGDAIVKFK